jgi:hypothetical protein
VDLRHLRRRRRRLCPYDEGRVAAALTAAYHAGRHAVGWACAGTRCSRDGYRRHGGWMRAWVDVRCCIGAVRLATRRRRYQRGLCACSAAVCMVSWLGARGQPLKNNCNWAPLYHSQAVSCISAVAVSGRWSIPRATTRFLSLSLVRGTPARHRSPPCYFFDVGRRVPLPRSGLHQPDHSQRQTAPPVCAGVAVGHTPHAAGRQRYHTNELQFVSRGPWGPRGVMLRITNAAIGKSGFVGGHGGAGRLRGNATCTKKSEGAVVIGAAPRARSAHKLPSYASNGSVPPFCGSHVPQPAPPLYFIDLVSSSALSTLRIVSSHNRMP